MDGTQGMLDANATHIALTLEGISVDLQVLSFVGREALNQPFCFDIELVSPRPDLKLEEIQYKPGCLTFGATGKGIIHGLVYRIEQGDSGKAWPVTASAWCRNSPTCATTMTSRFSSI
ncbi:hypothetical protein [Enterobacter kobei]|uniref:hypothetical protein n=2 Tax=Enterobacter kobei TaxID=208224 RepID=UPI00388FEDAD